MKPTHIRVSYHSPWGRFFIECVCVDFVEAELKSVPDTDDQNDGIQESFNGFPEIVEAVKLARKVKARRILWDRDGNVIPQLPTYDW